MRKNEHSRWARSMRRGGAVLLVLAGLASVTLPAHAGVIYDPATGTGFVGKGTVQNAFGWSSRTLQQQTGNLEFTASYTVTYVMHCSYTGYLNGNPVERHVERHLGESLAYGTRTKGQAAGFLLTGIAANTSDFTVPRLGGTCPGFPGGSVVLSLRAAWNSGVQLFVADAKMPGLPHLLGTFTPPAS